ncbi:MAG: sugar transferase [Alphaproteobacteria bacterium]
MKIPYFDFMLALMFLILFWWLFLLCWISVKISSTGPGIFRQQRVGRYGNPFWCYKFRTMRVGTPEAGTHEIAANSITPIGRFFRKTRLDELPQIFNILSREMNFVGPRPCLTVQHDLINARKQRGVDQLMPGITGLAQIEGIDMQDPVRLAKKDAEYLNNRSFLLDIRIIFRTLFKTHGEFHRK